ncbi:hypothetical protein GCM10028804_59470 [Larkinella terrae]
MERRAVKIARAFLQAKANSAIARLEDGGIDAFRERIEEFATTFEVRTLLQELYNVVGPAYAEREFDLVASRTRMALKREGGLFNIGFFSRKWMQVMRSLMASEETARRITNITETTRRLIREALERAQLERLDIRATARVISEVLGGKALRNRALLIARTESTRAANIAAEMGAETTGLKLEKLWIATADSRTRPAHRAMLGKKAIPKDALFNVGGAMMKHPGDPAGGVANIANCRCCVTYVPVIRNGTAVPVDAPDLPQRMARNEILQEQTA